MDVSRLLRPSYGAAAATEARMSPTPPETIESRKAEAAAWFATLRDRICAAFEAIEDDHAGPFADRPA